MAELTAFRAGLVLDGRYRLERPLAEGGMGSVWVGHQIALEREVAVKLLRVGSGPLRARLRREALALAAVHHPSVVQVFDYGETPEGAPYLVMELVRGEPLGARILKAGPLPVVDAVRLALPLLDGLATAHAAGVVHRDIKPDNVVIATGPSGPQPKLLDFGIARMERTDEARLTAEGGFIGTPAYMSPEQVQGLAIDERVDVWGMGAVLYEMIAGKSPFGMEDVVAVIRRVLDDPPSFPRDARGLDGKLWAAITGALRKDPAERTPSAVAFRNALASWLEGKGIAPSSSAFSHDGASGRAGAPHAPDPLSFHSLPATQSSPPGAIFAASASASTVDADADTAPVASPHSPASFDALIRAKLGQS